MRAEVRHENDGHEVDEVLLYNDAGECVFHLERMDDDAFFLALYPSGTVSRDDDAYFDVFRDKKHVRVVQR